MHSASRAASPRLLRHTRHCLRAHSSGASASMATATTSPAAQQEEVRVTTTPSGLGCITLCRERQLNSLQAHHVEAIRSQLLRWAGMGATSACGNGSSIKCVLLDSASEKSFCSGGDVKAARQAVLDQPYADAPPPGHHIHRVFEAEYSTVLLTAAHPNLIACCQGFWMGLGFGIAGYAPVRIVSDGTVFAMPENAIGLWPDVGFAFKAAHMAQHAGLFLGLSGVRASDAADLLHYGIGTHYIPQEQLQAFKAALADNPAASQQLLQQYSQVPALAPGPLQRLMPHIEPYLSQLVASYHNRQEGCDELQVLHTLMHQLQEALPSVRANDHGAGELLHHAINGLQYGSPRSLVITLQHFCKVASQQQQQLEQQAGGGSNGGSSGSGGGCLQLPPVSWPLGVTVDGAAAGAPDLSTLQGVMQMEYRMAVRQVAHEDFIEGVRAALVDKDRQPGWLSSGAADSSSGVGGQRDHHLRLSVGGEEEPPKKQLLGNRFSVQHLYTEL